MMTSQILKFVDLQKRKNLDMPRMKYKYKEKHNYNKGSFYCKKIVLHHK